MVVRLVMGIINGNSSAMHTPSTQKDELERLFSFCGERFSHFVRLTWKIVCDTTEYLHSALIGYLHPIIVSIHAHFYQKKKRERKKGAHGVGKTRVLPPAVPPFYLLTVPASSDIQRRSIILVTFPLWIFRPRGFGGGFRRRRWWWWWWCGHNDRLHAGRVDGGATRLTPTVRRA